MRRFLVFVCMIATSAACVNLSKPQKVAECVANNNCVNSSPVDGGVTSPDGKADGKKDTSPFIDGPSPDAAKPDAILPPSDVLPINPGIDGGELPDTPMDDTPIVDDGGALPEVPVTFVDGSNDLPIVVGDAPADGAKLDVPIFADAKNDVSVDTRDAYRDVVAGMCAPGGVIQPAGTPCRSAAGLCDIAETCDGVSADCPADKLEAAGKSCRAVAGDCDLAETCTGTSADCPADGFKQAGAVCRAAVPGGCDVAESCTGAAAVCPVDSLAPSTTVCRASTDTNKCDPAENCTGSSTTCPSDVIYTLPAVPGTVAAAAGTQQASISWAAASGATGYNVKRSTTSGSGYTTLGSTPTTTASPYVNDGLAAGTYYYVVSSINTIATCESANSTQVSAIPTNPCTPPALIANLSATPGNGAITLAWTAPATATVYTVYRKNASSIADFAPIATNIAPTTPPSYKDQSVVFGTSYVYVVTASNGTCSSDNSNAVTASPLCSPPATTPTGLAVSIPTVGAQVTLTWTGSADAQTYLILRKLTSASTYAQIVQVTGTTLTYTDSGLTNGTSYDYVLTSNNGTCASTASAAVTAVPQCSVAKPVIQTPVTVGDKEVDLTWSTPTGAVNYTLSRKVSTGTTYAVITTPALTVTSYADKDAALVNGTTYNYVVSASNGNCASANSDAVTATPVCTPPASPGTLSASAGDAKVTLTWIASASSPTSYTIQRKTGAGGTYADLFTTANGTTLSYVDTTAANGTTYYYQVRANKGSCSSATYSNEASATPQPTCSQGAPGTPTATMATGTQVKVDWPAANPAPSGGYNIGRSTNSTTGYASIGSVAGTIVTFTDPAAGLTIGATYYYQITAIGASCSTTSATGSIALACQTPSAPTGVTATNNGSNGQVTVTWTAPAGATAYTVSRSTVSGPPYTAIPAATNITTATYVDSGLSNATTYYYVVSASNANHQCVSGQSSQATTMSCIIPAVPTGLSAMRSGNKQVTLVWTNSTDANNYSVQRGTTSGSESQITTTTGTTYTDTVPSNTAAYYYVVKARSDSGGNCSSANSAEVSVPACVQLASGTSNYQPNPQTTGAYCFITCGTTIPTNNYNASNFDGRVLTVNGSTMTCPSSGQCTTNLPAQGNGGYVFQVAACPASGTCYAWSGNSWWGNTTGNCP